MILLILAIGILLRTAHFPNNPPGLFWDEAIAGYEAYSLFHTGRDRWNLFLPVYFIASGVGQNVLYSYMTIPFVATFGLDIFSTRLLNVFLGILTVPLLFASVKRMYGKHLAIISCALLALVPWHVMSSRWGQEFSSLPIFLLLGVYGVFRGLEQSQARGWLITGLIALGLSHYVYIVSSVVTPIFVALVLLLYRGAIRSNWRIWFFSLLVFGMITLPISLFLYKNLFSQDGIGIEHSQPFAIPVLPFSRLAQVVSPLPLRLEHNLNFVLTGFQDGDIRWSTVGVPPMFSVMFPLTFLGALSLIRRSRERNRVDIFLLWLASCLPLFILFDAAVHRVHAILIPILVIGAHGAFDLSRTLRRVNSRRILTSGLSLLVALQFGLFATDYFWSYASSVEATDAFSHNFRRALAVAKMSAEQTEEILVTSRVPQSYALVAFYLSYPPDKYQREVKYNTHYGEVSVESFGRYYFSLAYLPEPKRSFVYLFSKWDEAPCANPTRILETRLWQVGRCGQRPSVGASVTGGG